jgi:dienelactone hydrolase
MVGGRRDSRVETSGLLPLHACILVRQSLSTLTSQSAPSRKHSRRPTKIVWAVIIVVVIFQLGAHRAYTHLRAVGLLLRIQDPDRAGMVARLGTYTVDVQVTSIITSSGTVRARVYVPQGVTHPPGMVIVHGVHHLGIDEPRLVKFARAVSASGIRVLTPELPALADYQIDNRSVSVIGESTRHLSTEIGQKVGLLGLSFAGGLSLLAAADAQYAPYIQFVVSVGSHDDLERVSGFLVTNSIARPDGTILQMPAHEYGPLVVIYSHVGDFFPPGDVDAARNALRLLLWEQVDESRKAAEQLSPPSRETMELLYKHQAGAVIGEMKQVIAQHRAEMAAVSPHGHLGSLRVPVSLLHGAADNVIPPSELLWLQQDVPQGYLKSALISPAISHVSMDGEPSPGDKLRLIHFMAQMLEMTGEVQPLAPAR